MAAVLVVDDEPIVRARDAREDRSSSREAERRPTDPAERRPPRARRDEARGAQGRTAVAADGEGVRAPLVPCIECEPCLLARPADAPRVGLFVGARHRNRHGARATAAREARGRRVEPEPARDGLGRRLPVARMSSVLPTMRLRLAALVLAAVCLPLGVVLTSGWVMFGMHDDVKVVLVSVGSAGVGLVAALLMARWILRPLEALRGASARLAGGDLGARAAGSGPRELVELSSSFNEMATNIEQLFDARRQLVAWASHDLRTPLASLSGMVEALE